ncbi:MAG TPA: DUF2630 family protein [Mycobacteriales bacterium]|nr:DUF2630 family protein [Mycobacteriales bacterium]
MEDTQILGRIGELVAEEHQLRARAAGDGLDEQSSARLRALEEHLDQCWDLLRQRRAAEEFGQDPGTAHQRPSDEVESYLQ